MKAILLCVLILCLSCAKTEVLNVSVPQLDTLSTKAHRPPPKPPKDTTDQDGRVPIGWDATVEDWDETDEEL